MKTDVDGIEISVGTEDARDAWNGLVRGFLSHGASTPKHLGRLIDLEPHSPLGHATRALMSLTMGRRAMTQTARAALVDAEAAAKNIAPTPRETVLIEAARHWCAGHPDRAAHALDAYLDRVPHDSFAMKMVQAIRFMLGDARGMRRSLTRTAHAYGHDHPAHGFHLGARAFAWEETGDYDRAVDFGSAALEHTEDDAWALHAVAHVHDMRADPKAGLAWLEGRDGSFTHCNNFRYHVWWHKALMLLEQGRHDEALTLYDAEVRREHTDDYRDISNATSLLARLMLEGVDVGDRWQELADLSENNAEDETLTFGDMHTMLALVGDNRKDAQARLIAATARGAKRDDAVGRVMRDPGVALAQGLEAFGEGDHDRAAPLLASARPHFPTMGGSHAQRDVFERIAIEAQIRAGHLDTARRLLAARSEQRGGHEDSFARSRTALVRQATSLAAEGMSGTHGSHARLVADPSRSRDIRG